MMLSAMLWQLERRWIAACARSVGAAPARAAARMKGETVSLNGNGRNGHHPERPQRAKQPSSPRERSRAALPVETEPLRAPLE
jgi:hypothetical protein